MPRFLVVLSVISMIFLPACASKKETGPRMKIGMHIDAVLEFVVEYPLEWTKDRRLIFGSNSGEVRWTHPEDTNTGLRLFSYIKETSTERPEQLLGRLLPGYTGLTISLEEKTTIPAGESTHLIAQTTRSELEAYLLRTNGRLYMIVFTTSPGDAEKYAMILNRALQTFNVVQ